MRISLSQLLAPVIAVLITQCSQAQEQPPRQKFLGADVGVCFHPSEIQEYDFFQLTRTGTEEFSEEAFSTEYTKFFSSLKAELRSRNGKIGWITGIRYIQVNSSFWDADHNERAMYLLVNMDDDNIEFVTFNSIVQRNYYLGIPVAFRGFAYPSDHIRPYYKLAMESAIRVGTDYEVEFTDSGLDEYTSDITEHYRPPNDWFASAQLSLGVNFGKPTGLNIDTEVILLSAILTENASSILTDQYVGAGIVVQLYHPF